MLVFEISVSTLPVLFLFPKVKSQLKATHFLSVVEVQKNTTEILRSILEEDLKLFRNVAAPNAHVCELAR